MVPAVRALIRRRLRSEPSVVDILSIAILLGLLFVKEAGVPIPVPGDLLVLGAGVATASQPALAAAVLAAILVAGYAGGGLQFGLVRGALRRVILGAMARFGIPRSRIDTIAARLSRHGAR